MGIEERELHFPESEPLRGWRLFRVRADAEGPVLASPMIHDPDPPPWKQARHTAVCIEEAHPAPAPGCRCGIYACIPGTLDSLPGYLLDTAYDKAPVAYAEIACHGRVFMDIRGVRAEHAELLQIALTEDESAVDVHALVARYGVPVSGREAVPDWVTNNVREGGPPPEGASLDLDSLGF